MYMHNPPAKHGQVILATNIAESSITIPDVRTVIDLGLHREITYDEKRNMQALLYWCAFRTVMMNRVPHSSSAA
jgi:ATP-dependent helicase HrpB